MLFPCSSETHFSTTTNLGTFATVVSGSGSLMTMNRWPFGGSVVMAPVGQARHRPAIEELDYAGRFARRCRGSANRLPAAVRYLVRLNDIQPILSPHGTGFEARAVFNPAVVKHGDRFVMLNRAQDSKGISRVGYATSTDGVNFTRDSEPVLSPEAEYERGGGRGSASR